jgi:hypothetical protein
MANYPGSEIGKESYIMDVETKDRVYFRYVPETISDSVSPNYSSTDTIGRSSPIQSWSSTGARVISLQLEFVSSSSADDEPVNSFIFNTFDKNGKRVEYEDTLSDYASAGNERRVYIQCLFLRSFLYPRYGSNGTEDSGNQGMYAYPPPKAILSIAGYLKLEGIVKSCEITWKKPYTAKGFPMAAEVSLSFEAIDDIPLSCSQVRDGEDRFTTITNLNAYLDLQNQENTIPESTLVNR